MTTTKRIALAAAVLAVLSGCADDTDELRAKIAEVKSRPGGRIEPLPEVKPYETFAYAAANQRSPFEPGVPASVNAPNALRPDVNRPREFLEQFSLDTLRHTIGPALVITMLGLTEAVSIARSVAVKSGQRVDGNQEFIGQGLSNLVGSFFSAYDAATTSGTELGATAVLASRRPTTTVESPLVGRIESRTRKSGVRKP